MWIAKAQRWLQENADRLFAAWLMSKDGKRWKAQQYHYPRIPAGFGVNQRTVKYRPLTPYEMGFSLPAYHHELIEAVGKGDEEFAKSIMLYHGIGACTCGD